MFRHALVASVGLLQRRWDKISAWKGKTDEDEMVHAELTRSHAVNRSAAGIKAELDLVARLISGLPTNVEPGEYEASLATHLMSLSTALQLELEQTPEASGTNCKGVTSSSCCPSIALSGWPSWVPMSARAQQLPSLCSLTQNPPPTPSRTRPMPT
jgi:hypothetical protein